MCARFYRSTLDFSPGCPARRETPTDAGDTLAAEAYRTGEPSIVDDRGSRSHTPADPTFLSALAVPIGEYGVFRAVDETPEAFDRADLEMAELLVAHAHTRLAQLDTERQLRNQADALERQNEQLEEFASVVSHDLQNAVERAGPDVTIRVGDLKHGFYVAGDGTGFGLAIVEQVADANGWDVRVTEVQGESLALERGDEADNWDPLHRIVPSRSFTLDRNVAMTDARRFSRPSKWIISGFGSQYV